jgi:HD superfamily phosphohydrolase
MRILSICGDGMKDRVFRDPVHGLIELRDADRPIGRLLETRAFQRLRRVHQMGFAWQVYPGAEHSRFGHALGAFHIAQRVARQLALEPPIALHVKVAALLHDIGHGPFSHSWEQAFEGCDHEAWGARIVAEDPDLSAALEALEPGLAQVLGSFWSGTYAPGFARKLVSSQLDVDRLDYLLRDGHYSGAGYATFDLDWIIHALRIERVRDGADPSDLVVDYRRGMYAVEQYLFARTYMYAQVYHHKAVRAAEWMFLKILDRFARLARAGQEPAGLAAAGRLARGEHLPVADYLGLDDLSVTMAIDGWAAQRIRGTEAVLSDLADRFARRRLFKTIDLGDDPSVIDRIAAEVDAVARRRFGEAASSYYQLDTARQVGYAPGAGEELFVVGHPRHGTVSLGQLLEELPLGRPTSTVRLVCAPELVAELRPIASAALTAR